MQPNTPNVLLLLCHHGFSMAALCVVDIIKGPCDDVMM